MNLSFFIARRYLVRQKGRFSAFIIRMAMVATALSVATMIVALALITGFKKEIAQKIYSYWGHVHVTLYNYNNTSIISPEPLDRRPDIEQQISQLPGVNAIHPYIVRPALVNANRLMDGIQLKGVDANYDFASIESLSPDFSDTAYSKEIVLSKTTMNRLKLKKGDEVMLYFLDGENTYPRIRRMKVAGSYHTGMEDIDKRFAICDIRLLQNINQWGKDKINGYQLSLDDEQLAQPIADKIFEEILPRDTRMVASSMQEIFPGIFDWLALLDNNGVVVLVIMGIVAVINLLAALLILIVNRARMVGLLKALGMAESGIRTIFMYYAAMIGGVGIVAGNLLALALCVLQQQTHIIKLSEAEYSVEYVPVDVVWWHPLAVSLCTLLVCTLCMWLPTLYIRRVQPARVLQFK